MRLLVGYVGIRQQQLGLRQRLQQQQQQQHFEIWGKKKEFNKKIVFHEISKV